MQDLEFDDIEQESHAELPTFNSDSDDSEESPTVGSTVSESFFKSH